MLFESLRKFNGMDVIIIPNPYHFEYFGPPERVPSKAQGRKGTKRSWKLRRNRVRTGWRRVAYEPKHMLSTRNTIMATERQYQMIKAQFGQRAYLDPVA